MTLTFAPTLTPNTIVCLHVNSDVFVRVAESMQSCEQCEFTITADGLQGIHATREKWVERSEARTYAFFGCMCVCVRMCVWLCAQELANVCSGQCTAYIKSRWFPVQFRLGRSDSGSGLRWKVEQDSGETYCEKQRVMPAHCPRVDRTDDGLVYT